MDSSDQAGWVLTGGQSTRMGRDKALLPWNGRTIVENVADAVREAAGSVTLVGAPERYVALGLAAVPDEGEHLGPLSGLYTALKLTHADWNLVVACDMPRLTAGFLRELLERAKKDAKDCLVPQTSRGLEPLCAVYHRRVLPAAEWAVRHNILKMQEFVRSLDLSVWPVPQDAWLENWNTPRDLAAK